MLRYAARRLLLAIPTLLGVALLTFFLLRVVPGDVVELKLRADGGNVTREMVEQERARLGLDRPLAVQFGGWMAGLVTLDLGQSMWTGRPVSEEIGARIGLTLQVAVMAALLGVLVAVPLGAVSALFPNSPIDYLVRIVTIAGLAVPSFWLA